jgi:DNA-directed RNA polymerase specialized sigma24 family protein
VSATAGNVVPPGPVPGPADAGMDEALRAARSGDEGGFVVLYRDLQPRLLRYATALVGAEAEDVTAETWLQVARDLRGFTGDLGGFRGWVSTICRNRAMGSARTRTFELGELGSDSLRDPGRRPVGRHGRHGLLSPQRMTERAADLTTSRPRPARERSGCTSAGKRQPRGRSGIAGDREPRLDSAWKGKRST